jgi:MFS family permease
MVANSPYHDDLVEKTPLMQSEFPYSIPRTPGLPTPHDTPSERAARKFQRYVLLLIVLLLLAVDLPSVLQGTSSTRIIEDIYCEKWYKEHNSTVIGSNGKVEESLCKIDGVQNQLSSLRGWMTFWDHLPSLFLAVPFGLLADKYGRKWLFVLNIVSMQLRGCWSYGVCKFMVVQSSAGQV